MVIAFKLSKIGSRYMPKPQRGGKDAAAATRDQLGKADGGTACNGRKRKREEGSLDPDQIDPSNVGKEITEELEPSFAVNLFLDGFSIGTPTEKGKAPPYGYELPDAVYPYDRTSDNILRSIDRGWLPTELLDDIPCSYVDGCVACELRDYRDSVPSTTLRVEHATWLPKVQKMVLRPSTETIVKDIAAMADESWSYRDLLEVESRILKTINPTLNLDPSPKAAVKAHTESYNRLKFNVGRQMRCFRPSKGVILERRIRLESSRNLMRQENISKRLRSPDKAETPGGDTKSDHSVEIIQESLAVQSKDRAADPALQRTLSGQLPLSPPPPATMVPTMVGKIEPNKKPKMDVPLPLQQRPKVNAKPRQFQYQSEMEEQKLPEEHQKFAIDQQIGDFRRMQWKQNYKAPSPIMSAPSPATPLPDPGLLSPKQAVVAAPPTHVPGPLDLQFSQALQQPFAAGGQFVGGSQVPLSQYARPRQNSFPVASPPVNSPSTSGGVQGSMVNAKPENNIGVLLQLIQRHGLHKKETKVDDIPPPPKNSQPSWQLLSVALADTTDEERADPKGEKSLATYLVAGNVNARKTRFLQFERKYQIMGQFVHTTRQRLLLCGRGKDAMVEAVIQILDDQDEDNAQHPYIVLPAIANADTADLYARQFIKQLKKEGYELTEDVVQSSFPRQMNNAPARAMPPGTTPMQQVPSPRMMMNQQMPPAAAARMPPPTGMPGRQINYNPQQLQRPLNAPLSHLHYQVLAQQQQRQQQAQQQQQLQQQQLHRKALIQNNMGLTSQGIGMGVPGLQGLNMGQLGLPGMMSRSQQFTPAQMAAFQKQRFASQGRGRPVGGLAGQTAQQVQNMGMLQRSLNPGMRPQGVQVQGVGVGMGPPRAAAAAAGYYQFQQQQQQQFNQQLVGNQQQFGMQQQVASPPQMPLSPQQMIQQQQQQQMSAQLAAAAHMNVAGGGGAAPVAVSTPLPGTPLVGTPTMVGTPLVGTPQPQSPQVSSHSLGGGGAAAAPPGSPLEMQQQHQQQQQQQTSSGSGGVTPAIPVI